MRRATKESLPCRLGARAAILLTSSAAAALASAMGGCDAATVLGACSGPTSFQVFEPGLPSSAVPLCTDSADADVAPQTLDSGADASFFGPISTTPFPGASTLSAEGLAQCTAICAGATNVIPCCQSQWEPSTILCVPSCQ